MVQTPERQTTTIKKDVADKIPDAMPLPAPKRCGDMIQSMRPQDCPRGMLLIAIEGNPMTPEQRSCDLSGKREN